jgi:ABC-type proline/glycine betaine transport system substrate-binding protein
MKKAALIISTLALALSPVAAFAQQAQSNVQAGSNAAVTQGYGNYTNQAVSNDLTQTQLDVDGYSIDPQIQNSVQAGQNQSATFGVGNVTDQSVTNSADQLQSDFDFPVYPY